MKRRMSPWGAGLGGGRRSESVAMASGLPDVTTNQEPATEECTGKKKSKFQTFKKLFTRKKRKDPSTSGDAELKASQSSDNVSKTSANNTLSRSEKDKGSGSKISLGSKALSHDSVFVSDSSEANEALGASQDSIHGKVKSLQMQLKQAIRLGSPPSLMCVKRTEEGGTMSEDDGLPCSPPEYTNHTTQVKAQRNSFISLDSDEDQLSCTASSRAVSPLVVAPGDFSQPASPLVCLDNSAAKHKLGLRHMACNKRKPASRVELRTEGDSALEETLNNSIPESSEEAQDVCDEELKPEEQKDEEVSLSSESETKEEENTEAERDVSVKEDTSCEQRVQEETDSEDDEARDSPRATLEPPAGQREYLLDPPGFTYGTENKQEQSETLQDEKLQEEDEADDEAQKPLQEEESSLLQEVLSSLKTPLTTLETERDVPDKYEENKEETKEEVEEEEEEEEEEMEDVDKEEAEETVVVRPESTESNTVVSEQTFGDEEEPKKQEVVMSFYKDAEEEMKTEEEETEEEEEEPVVEHFKQSDLVEEVEKKDTKESQEEEETSLPATQSENKEEEAEETQKEVENEGIELEPVEEALEMTEQEVYESEEQEDETEAAILEDEQKADKTEETICDDGKIEMAVELEENREDVDFVDKKETQVEADDVEVVSEEKELGSIQDETEDREDTVEQDGDVDQTKEKINNEEEKMEVTEVKVESEEAEIKEKEEEESEEMSQEEVTPVNTLEEAETEEKPLSSPTKSKTATTTLQINLVSPSAEKVTSPFEFAPEMKEEVREEVKDEKAEVQETSNEENSEQSKPDHDKVRFTIAPSWQRSLSIGDVDGLSPPSTPPVSVFDSVPGLETKEEGTIDDVEEKTEQSGLAKVELVLSPTREKTAAAKPQTPAATKTQTEDSSVGNPHNPFGVRLRKTQALQRFISEDENTESVHEPTAQMDKPDPPLGVTPSINPPISNKPAVPKKPEMDSGGKVKRISDPAAARGGSEAPSWISVAKQKQKIYKENSAEKITVSKEEQEKSSVSAVSSKTHEPSNKVSPVELLKPSLPLENVSRRPLSPPTPVPPQPLKSYSPTPCPVPPKPQSCPLPLSPPATVAPSCISPPPPPPSPKPNPALTSRPATLQDEPPWMALAKKKAKAWSEMPQIVQ